MDKGKGKEPAYCVAADGGGAAAGATGTRPGLAKRDAPKKLVIKAFKVKPKLPENYVANTWSRLEQAVRAIHSQQSIPDSLEELYQACENLCYHKKADELYGNLRALCDGHAQAELRRIGESTSSTASILHVVNDSWVTYCRQMILIRSIFLYLDRTYVLHTSGLRSLWDMALELYRQRILDDSHPLKSRLVHALLAEIERERNGEQIDRNLLRSLLRMFMDLSIYYSSFDTVFRDASEKYYQREGGRLVSELEDQPAGGPAVGRYLQHVGARLAQEVERCTAGVGYLDLGSRKGLLAIVENMLVRKHVKALLDNGLDELMDSSSIKELGQLYSLFSRVGALDQLRTAFVSYLRKTGQKIVTSQDEVNMVDDLLAFRDRVIDIIKESFASSDTMHNAMKEAFEFFINQRQNRPAELVAKWIDAKLKTSKGVTDEDLEAQLDKSLLLFRYIQGKDIFEAFYKKDLAKRLLLQKSTSVDAEKSMLSKLKIECGPGFTSKLEGMFKDIEISKDYMTSFRESAKYTTQLGNIDFSVNVLTHGYWPTYTPVPCLVPPEIEQCQKVFLEFYESKHKGRRLTWQSLLGSGILRCEFKKGKKELSVSLFQAMVILLFNDYERLTYADIVKLTGLDDKEVTRTLQSLSLGKLRILNIDQSASSPTSAASPRTPTKAKTKDLHSDDAFTVNDNFDNPLYRIKINQIQMKETVEERDKTEEGVFQDRQYSVDAAVVRIMKSRKRLKHSQLIAELGSALKFTAKPADLKKRIESLIDREYLERDAKDSDVYVYLA
ncbi:ubiquitin-protein ligase, cullin 4 [Fimicolochytrium jonesii]|uniref:ubiquitin-protein ligase, cullin 4 n=1 Tax=Fimicolochytrium jonesii TaxID=1396493 RepID=UPI0022FF44A0|nr:ubiquitin-protein ligase, cullin 4 [Fimicolochytrium jonesii]KAI8820589.1 ubiquitin-protein ligase, cullin 4 [Fimicolochytrium jonesii]